MPYSKQPDSGSVASETTRACVAEALAAVRRLQEFAVRSSDKRVYDFACKASAMRLELERLDTALQPTRKPLKPPALSRPSTTPPAKPRPRPRFFIGPDERKLAVSGCSIWRQIALRRISGALSTEVIVIFERVLDEPSEPTMRRLRVWFRGAIDQEPWLRVRDLDIESPRVLTLVFPSGEFQGFPSSLSLLRPADLKHSPEWLVRGEDGKRIEARFRVDIDRLVTRKEVRQAERRFTEAGAL